MYKREFLTSVKLIHPWLVEIYVSNFLSDYKTRRLTIRILSSAFLSHRKSLCVNVIKEAAVPSQLCTLFQTDLLMAVLLEDSRVVQPRESRCVP